MIKRAEIPEIPEKKEDWEKILEQLQGKFEIIERQQSVSLGTNMETTIKLKCNFCKSEFFGIEQHGCFNYKILPYDCPVCGFPGIILRKIFGIKQTRENK